MEACSSQVRDGGALVSGGLLLKDRVYFYELVVECCCIYVYIFLRESFFIIIYVLLGMGFFRFYVSCIERRNFIQKFGPYICRCIVFILCVLCFLKEILKSRFCVMYQWRVVSIGFFFFHI